VEVTAGNQRDAIARRLAQLDACAVCDALDSLSLAGAALGLHSLSVPGRIAGRVITVDLTEAGGSAPRRHLGTAAIDAATPGDVIVVAHHGRTDVSGWGGVLCAGACQRGVAGVIVDGAVRDVDQAAGYGLPVFAAAAVPRTARGRVAERDWNVPVTIAGVAVSPGDYVIADGSGVVFVPRAHAEAVLTKAEAIAGKEERMAARALAGEPMADVMSHDYESMLSERAD
jgi:4-hydroxy-4-methyl-2-oxoglutarate aldolase